MCATVGSRNEGSQAKIIYALRYLWDGWYVVQRIPKRLNVVAMDQVLQQTINKDEESKLWVIGLTVKNQHWLDGSRQGVLLQIMLNHIGHCRRTPSKIRTQRIGEGMKKFMVKCLKGDGFWKHLPKSTWSRESTNRTPWFCYWQIRLRWCMQKKKEREISILPVVPQHKRFLGSREHIETCYTSSHEKNHLSVNELKHEMSAVSPLLFHGD